MARQKYTLADVANEAGVSVMTVSRVVNNKGEISEETRRQVQSVIDRMQYRPNRAARSLVTRRSYTIGVVVPDITNPFFANIVRGVEDEAWEHGYNILLNNTVEQLEREESALRLLEETGAEGLVVCSPRLPDSALCDMLQNHQAVVAINRHIPESIGTSITPDHKGLMIQFEYMLNAGYRHMAALLHSSYHMRNGSTLHYLEQQQDHVLPLARVYRGLPTWEFGYRWMYEHYPTLRGDIDALICSNDLIALGVLHACKEQNIQVPGELALIGNDDIPASKLVDPPLTTLSTPQYEVGRSAMQVLLKKFDPTYEITRYPAFDLQLVIRQSA